MFDKLIESDTAGAEFKNRSRYFMVSTIVVGILFLTAVVYSLYASEVGLGRVNFDIAELIAPLPDAEPELPKVRTDVRQPSQDKNQQANQYSIMASTDDPTITPSSVSSTQNPVRSRDWRTVNLRMPESSGQIGAMGANDGRSTSGSSSTLVTENNGDENTAEAVKPPPAVKKPPTILRTSKVLNGEAISLPKPTYPQPAVLLNLQGSVKVQVTIDEKGQVISAKAADGHPFFRLVSEQAARSARFRPTLLNDEPVKVTGVIVYNFKRN